MRRREDRRHGWGRFIRENAYRDVWLFVLTGIVLWAAVGSWNASHDAVDAVDAVQEERARNVYLSCEETNERHDETLGQLDALLDRELDRVETPEERARIRASRTSTGLLIGALVPKRDCERRVREQVNVPPQVLSEAEGDQP
jgi:hypothetical protein